jgi:hypothetical protein
VGRLLSRYLQPGWLSTRDHRDTRSLSVVLQSTHISYTAPSHSVCDSRAFEPNKERLLPPPAERLRNFGGRVEIVRRHIWPDWLSPYRAGPVGGAPYRLIPPPQSHACPPPHSPPTVPTSTPATTAAPPASPRRSNGPPAQRTPRGLTLRPPHACPTPTRPRAACPGAVASASAFGERSWRLRL